MFISRLSRWNAKLRISIFDPTSILILTFNQSQKDAKVAHAISAVYDGNVIAEKLLVSGLLSLKMEIGPQRRSGSPTEIGKVRLNQLSNRLDCWKRLLPQSFSPDLTSKCFQFFRSLSNAM